VILLPDVVRIVYRYLVGVPEVQAIVGDRVYSVFPRQLTEADPFVLVQRIGGTPVLPRPLVIDTALMQLDAYGGKQAVAHTLVATCRAALAELNGEQPNDDGNVCGVVVGALRYVPDETFPHPRPRYISDVEITVKPAGAILAGAA